MKVIYSLYGLLCLVALSIVLVACQHRTDERIYKFVSSKFDENPDFTEEALLQLYNQGVTVRRLENENYFIKNIFYTGDSLGYSVLESGPIEPNYHDLYQIKLTNLDQGKVRVRVDINFTSYFKGNIYNIEFSPSWVVYTEDEGYLSVKHLTPIIINYPNILGYGDETTLHISWETDQSYLQSKQLYLSIEMIASYSRDKSFKEVVTFNLDRFNRP